MKKVQALIDLNLITPDDVWEYVKELEKMENQFSLLTKEDADADSPYLEAQFPF